MVMVMVMVPAEGGSGDRWSGNSGPLTPALPPPPGTADDLGRGGGRGGGGGTGSGSSGPRRRRTQTNDRRPATDQQRRRERSYRQRDGKKRTIVGWFSSTLRRLLGSFQQCGPTCFLFVVVLVPMAGLVKSGWSMSSVR